MRNALLVAMVVSITGALYVIDIAGIMAPIAKTALLLVPAVFAVSLVVGFATRMRSWFE